MKNNNVFDDIAKKITGLLPENISQLQSDFESNVKAAVQNGLAKMNLVTREEFDIQTALLERSREKLDQLEKQLSRLIDEKNKGKTD